VFEVDSFMGVVATRSAITASEYLGSSMTLSGPAGVLGLTVTGPSHLHGSVSAGSVSALSGSFSGGVRGYGSSTFDTLAVGNASVSSLSLNGPLTVGALGRMPTPQYYTSGMWGSSPAWYRIGTWLAPQNGRLLKLNVVACGNGYHVGGGLFPMPSPLELEIYFHTSNGVSFQGDGCYGNGWVTSKHVAFPSRGVRVEYGTVDSPITTQGFAFWVAVSGYPGEWLTTVTTRFPWVSNTSGPHSSAPARSIPLMVSPLMHSVISASAYGPVIGLTTQPAHPPPPAPVDPRTLHPFEQ
jgi:hypothetical protein